MNIKENVYFNLQIRKLNKYVNKNLNKYCMKHMPIYGHERVERVYTPSSSSYHNIVYKNAFSGATYWFRHGL